MTFPPVTLGLVVALVVLILAVLGAIGVLPMTAVVVFGLFILLSIARLV